MFRNSQFVPETYVKERFATITYFFNLPCRTLTRLCIVENCTPLGFFRSFYIPDSVIKVLYYKNESNLGIFTFVCIFISLHLEPTQRDNICFLFILRQSVIFVNRSAMKKHMIAFSLLEIYSQQFLLGIFDC